jgi:hypothetical protein
MTRDLWNTVWAELLRLGLERDARLGGLAAGPHGGRVGRERSHSAGEHAVERPREAAISKEK